MYYLVPKRCLTLTHFIRDTTQGVSLLFVRNTPAVVVFTFHVYFHFRDHGVACVGPTSRESPKECLHMQYLHFPCLVDIFFVKKKKEEKIFWSVFLAKWQSEGSDIVSDLSDISDR